MALLAFATAVRSGCRRAGWIAIGGWAALAATGAYLAWDEVAAFHETLEPSVSDEVISRVERPYLWPVVLSPLIVAFAVAMGFFVRKELHQRAVRAPFVLGLVAWLLAVAHEVSYPFVFSSRDPRAGGRNRRDLRVRRDSAVWTECRHSFAERYGIADPAWDVHSPPYAHVAIRDDGCCGRARRPGGRVRVPSAAHRCASPRHLGQHIRDKPRRPRGRRPRNSHAGGASPIPRSPPFQLCTERSFGDGSSARHRIRGDIFRAFGRLGESSRGGLPAVAFR